MIRAGRLLDVRTGQVARNMTITVEHGRIVSVNRAVPAPGDSVVDLAGTHRAAGPDRRARAPHDRRHAP
jgi:adenine deaminase